MSNLFEVLKQRRSVRKFLSKPVSKELVLTVLEAAGWAPSAHNSQPWRFIVIDNPTIRRELAEKMANAWIIDMTKDGCTVDEPKRIERKERFITAPVLILACTTLKDLIQFGDEERQRIERDLAVESLGAGLENLLLAAHASGLGACWYCAPAFCKEIVREVLKIPDEVEPAALIVIGYPAESPLMPIKKSVSEFCYLDVWGRSY